MNKRRDAILRKMGYSSYDAYLRGDLWQTIRVRVLTRDNYKCRMCNRAASQVHHRGYGWYVLNGLDDYALASLCGLCHERAEFNPDGRKRKRSKVGRIVNVAAENVGNPLMSYRERKRLRKLARQNSTTATLTATHL